MSRDAGLLLAIVSSAALAADQSELVHQAALGWTQAAVKEDGAALQRAS